MNAKHFSRYVTVHFPIFAALLLGVNFGECASQDHSMTNLVSANGAFAVDLYHHESAQPGNLFFSPYSISTALAMTCAGARGQTEKEMRQVLHFTGQQADVYPGFASLQQRMDAVSQTGKVNLSVANSIWCEKSYPFAEPFLKLNRDFFHAETGLLNFTSDAEGSRKQINSWVAKKTQDKISELLQSGQVTSQTKGILVNAVYFKGKWESQFDPRQTSTAPFFSPAGQELPTPFMSRTIHVRCREYPDFNIFALPYIGNTLSMVVLLPNARDGLGALEKQVDASHLRDWFSAMDSTRPAEADVFLPKFKLSSRLELAPTLAAMGMKTAFGSGADFSGMSQRRDLVISDVVHQAVVEVNEEGTEAAAATGVGMRATAVMRTITLRADHPFIFLIRENQSGSILFLGRLSNPAK